MLVKTISEQLVEASGRRLSIQPEGDAEKLYYRINDAAVEIEVGEFLFGLIRVMKPLNTLETGTHVGVGAAYLAAACQANNHGKVTTLEFLPEHYQTANELFACLGLQDHIDSRLTDAKDYLPARAIDFLFLDTEPQTRFAELLKFYPHVRPGGIIGIHDLHPHMGQVPNAEHGDCWPYGPIPTAFRALVVDGDLRPVHFRTPRGLTLFYKTAPEDYDWEYGGIQ